MAVTVRAAHTADPTPAGLRAVRGLPDDAFDGGFGDGDRDHAPMSSEPAG